MYSVFEKDGEKVLVKGMQLEFEGVLYIIYKAPATDKVLLTTDFSTWHPTPRRAIKAVKALIIQKLQNSLAKIEKLMEASRDNSSESE